MWQRYVAIGDSTTEGLDDPDGAGGYRGWADRFALAVARAQGGLEYANLAIRGRTTALIRAEQLQPALDLAPDLATVVAGMNDVLRPPSTRTRSPVMWRRCSRRSSIRGPPC
ncbi:SGNH/GDSL hydrolase family protein [Micromonospora sp. M51]|uniref:SGNH/GDSL hydrolase family protein n=1 Tax=Micromonospora sp. M51 TaxID=2824889 RepID=UPI0021117CB8|nr:SGNH/GDSL hydrolase family protein [Micromonospora sp. M51]